MDILTFLISIILILAVGIATGIMIGSYGFSPIKIAGKLIIATDEEDGNNYIFLEMDKITMSELRNRQIVSLKVSDRTRK